jgi:phage baseplate assembly protein W
MPQDNVHYKIPFNPISLCKENGQIETCSLAESIAQNLMLLVLTKQGENRFDKQYGNAVWNTEFENTVTESEWEEIFQKSMHAAIAQHEKRIMHPAIKVRIVNVEKNSKLQNFTTIKKKAIIHITAQLTASGENYNFSTELFLSPMFVE